MHERKHRLVKRFADSRRNLQSWSKQLLAEIALQQLYHLEDGVDPVIFDSLRDTPLAHQTYVGCWLVCLFVGWLVCVLARLLAGSLVGFMVGRLACWLSGWLA